MDRQLIKNIVSARYAKLPVLPVAIRNSEGRYFLYGESGYEAGEGSKNCSLYQFPIPEVRYGMFRGELIHEDVKITRTANAFKFEASFDLTYSYFGVVVEAVRVHFTINTLKTSDNKVQIIDDENGYNIHQVSSNYYYDTLSIINQHSVTDIVKYIPNNTIDSGYIIPPYTINTCFKAGDSAYIDEQQQVVAYYGHLSPGVIFKNESNVWIFKRPDFNIYIDYPKNVYNGWASSPEYPMFE